MIEKMKLFILLLFAFPAWAEVDISGSYKCTGYDPYIKGNYDTELVIKKTGETYSFKWEEMEESFDGTGFISKLIPGVFVAEFWNTQYRVRSGIMIFKIKEDGTFDGEWVRAEKDLVGTEVCKKKK